MIDLSTDSVLSMRLPTRLLSSPTQFPSTVESIVLSTTNFRYRHWLLAHVIVVLAFFALGVAMFAGVAENKDNALTAAARRDHVDDIVLVQVGLLPAYGLMALLHATLTWPLARRAARRRLTRGKRVGRLRRLLWAFPAALLVIVLSLGPATYIGPGSLDTLARMAAAMISPSANLYLFKTWHLQEVFTTVFVGLMAMLLIDVVKGVARYRASRGVRRTMMVAGTAVALAACVITWRSCGEPERIPTTLPNIVIIGSDSLRYDHLGYHGYPRATSPNIDHIAEQSVDFERCYVATASTLESWASFLLGRYPAGHGLRYMFIGKEQADGVRENEESLPRVLRQLGYQSAVVGDWAANSFKLVDFGFDRTLTSDIQNLDVFLSEMALRSHLLIPHYFGNALGERLIPNMRQATSYMDPNGLVDDFTTEIDRASVAGKPFLGVLFLSCTHLPFLSSWPYNVKFTDPDYRGPNRFMVEFDVNDFIQHGFRNDHPPEVKQHVIDLYDGGVAQFDAAVGEVYRHLDQAGLLDNTVFIVTSDHGEDLYEEDTTLGHGTNFFGGDQNNRIPFLVRLPEKKNAGRRVEGIVRNLDLPATLLDLIDECADTDDIRNRVGDVKQSIAMDGKSFMPYLNGDDTDLELAAFAETCYLFYPKNVPGEEVYAMEPADKTLFIDESFRDMFVLNPKYHDYVIETKDRMMRTPRWKLVYIKGRHGPIYRLWDMKNDPHQRTDLSREGLPVFDKMRERLHEWMETGKDAPWPKNWDDELAR